MLMNFYADICCHFSGIYIPRSKTAGSYGPCLIFEEMPGSFPKWLHYFTFPPAVYKGSNFPKSFPKANSCYYVFFYYSHPGRVKWYPNALFRCKTMEIRWAIKVQYFMTRGSMKRLGKGSQGSGWKRKRKCF